ncbi:hypothetical protein D0S45_00475 [Marinifilum sp. JC120]|nr:hypothetical protein D0S45_00475 [Marinifilum sp. JC120]
MKPKFVIAIEDDFEIMGNGTGHVAYHQHYPAKMLMNIARCRDIKLSFMVETAHRLVLERLKNTCRSINTQAHLWDDTVLEMLESGFDVQLHLHPQWLDAKYTNGQFELGNIWNIGKFTHQDQQALISNSLKLLNGLAAEVDNNHKIISFKAGSWGMQPSSSLLFILADNGIKIVMGVRQGMFFPEAGIDYRKLEESCQPYHPDFANIERVGPKSDITIIPLQPFAPDLLTFARYAFNQLSDRYRYSNNINYLHTQKISGKIKQTSPLGSKKINFSLHPYKTHLKIGNQRFSYLKTSFDTVIRNFQNSDLPLIPIVIECHTKQIHNYVRDIERFLDYILEKYEDMVEFDDMTGLAKKIAAGAIKVKSRS